VLVEYVLERVQPFTRLLWICVDRWSGCVIVVAHAPAFDMLWVGLYPNRMVGLRVASPIMCQRD
jgi:hypothetical protein